MTEKTNILACIQAAIHAPKGQRNEFGGFNYRSAEDILAHAKPILAEFDQSLVLEDEIVLIGDRYYIKATVTIHPLGAHAVAFAREQQDKKGMDHAQITGAASSYARKYALAGLLALDNEKDADTMDNKEDYSEAITAIKECESLEGLHEVWQSLSQAEKKAAQKVKDERKKILEGGAL